MSPLALCLAGAAAAAAILPFTLPARVHIERSSLVSAAPEQVFATLSSSRGFDQINPFRDADPSLKVAFEGPEAGVGAGFAFAGKDGAGRQTVTALEPNRRVVMQLDLGAMGRPVQSFALEPTDGGVKVTWSLDAEFGLNPVQRVAGLFMDGMLGPVYERGLANLRRLANNPQEIAAR